MVSTDLVTRAIRPPYTPVMILATDDKPDDTILRDYAWTARGPERHVAGAARWLAQDVNDSNGGFAVSLWDTLEDMHAYEQSAVFKQEIQPTLQPFFVGEYHTYR